MYKKINQVEKLIQKLRNKNNLSVSELADKIYVSRQAVHYWEKGRSKISIDTLKLILNTLGESVLIRGDGYEIIKDSNINKENQIEVSFKDFNLEDIIKKHREEENKFMKSTCAQFNKTLDIIKEQGYKININESYNPEMLYGEFCKEGPILTINKDGKTMGIEVKKDSDTFWFNFDEFIEDINNKYGKDIGEHIKKAICYRAYYSTYGDKIFNYLAYHKLRANILDIIPELSGYEQIVDEQIVNNWTKYFVELEGKMYDKEFPLSYCLNICLKLKNDLVLIFSEDSTGKKKYTRIEKQNYLILNSLEYIKDNLNEFDVSFEEC